MTDRKLALIVKDQYPLVLKETDTVRQACCRMWERRVGAVLVTDAAGRLSGIFTGRDAVRALAETGDAGATPLGDAMTPEPDTIGPEFFAIDALRAMSDRGYRHLPVVANGRILGIISRGELAGLEIERLEDENRLWECVA